MFNWDNTKAALQELQNVLICQQCKKMPDDPMSYNMCGHFFCKSCVRGDRNACPICSVPSRASEITSDRLIANLITGWKKISITIGFQSDQIAKDKEVESNKQSFRVSEVKNESENAKSIKTGNRKSSKRISDESSENKNSLTEEQPTTKKTRNSKSKHPRLSDNEKLSNASPIRKSAGTRNSISKDVNKRNAKGETQLHVACIKGKVEQVKNLLEAGANPNTKDHAGWTPLLEAVQHGYFDIAELLLKYGVMVNVPGCDNVTPLHEAAINNRLEMVKLLMMYGADVDARSIIGLTPKDIAQTEEMKNALNSGLTLSVNKPVVEMKMPILDPSQIVLYGCGLESNQQKQLSILSQRLKLKFVYAYSSEVTHIVVPTDANNVCPTTCDVIQGILQGKWIVNCDWITTCLEVGDLVDPEVFEVKGTSRFPESGAPKKGRINVYKQLPNIFNGCHIYLHGTGTNYTVENVKLTKGSLMTLIRKGDGVLLSREPDPESIPQKECTVPYHAPRNSPLANCSHYIIYRTGKDEPKLKYNMIHVKSLPLQWLLDCMETFNMKELSV